jgi:hypothetical protein
MMVVEEVVVVLGVAVVALVVGDADVADFVVVDEEAATEVVSVAAEAVVVDIIPTIKKKSQGGCKKKCQGGCSLGTTGKQTMDGRR